MEFQPPMPPKLQLEIKLLKLDPFLEKVMAKYGEIGGDITKNLSEKIKTSEERDINCFKEDTGSYLNKISWNSCYSRSRVFNYMSNLQ